jgi:hypothetical protein
MHDASDPKDQVGSVASVPPPSPCMVLAIPSATSARISTNPQCKRSADTLHCTGQGCCQPRLLSRSYRPGAMRSCHMGHLTPSLHLPPALRVLALLHHAAIGSALNHHPFRSCHGGNDAPPHISVQIPTHPRPPTQCRRPTTLHSAHAAVENAPSPCVADWIPPHPRSPM